MNREDLGETNKSHLGETNKVDLASPNTQAEGSQLQQSDKPQDQGEGLSLLGQDEARVKSDIDLVRCAVARHARFPIPERIRARAAEWLEEVASSKRYDGRARVNAVKALADLERLNMESEQLAQNGGVQRVDITSGGKPLGADLKSLSDEELRQRLAAAEGRALPGGE